MSGLNPNIVQVKVGVREVREATLYPLSMADQIALPDQIINAINQMGKLDAASVTKSVVDGLTHKAPADKDVKDKDVEDKDMATIKIVMDLIVDNFNYILKKSMDGVTMEDITNEQFVDIVDKIFTINYESSVGKVKDLVRRVKQLFRPETKEALGPALQE